MWIIRRGWRARGGTKQNRKNNPDMKNIQIKRPSSLQWRMSNKL